VDDIFRALSDPTRREIVRQLRSGERTAGELAEAFPLAKSTLSAHFTVLKQAGLITGLRRGQTIVYRLNASALHDLIGVVAGWLGKPRARRVARTRPAVAVPVDHLPAPATPPSPLSPAVASRGRVGAGNRTSFLRTGLLFFAAGGAGAASIRVPATPAHDVN